MSLSAIGDLNVQPQVTVQVIGQAGQPLTQETVTATETVKQESQNSTSLLPEAETAFDPVEVSDGEIMEGEEPSAELIKMNKMQQMAAEALASKQKQEQAVIESALASKVKSNPEEESKSAMGSQNTSKVKPDPTPIDGLPDDMVCAICMNARKTVMIQSCKHLVFCG